ncbi:hypothetical protein BKA56DRAFT_180816 [Ilyonectria sp. MPI-CAGE-AT-0026]|nr:hypothetical protein BKA56DRAFT_180816 [Ilyonectria sp. MPI-CAGE-AT-0026]
MSNAIGLRWAIWRRPWAVFVCALCTVCQGSIRRLNCGDGVAVLRHTRAFSRRHLQLSCPSLSQSVAPIHHLRPSKARTFLGYPRIPHQSRHMSVSSRYKQNRFASLFRSDSPLS